MRFAPAVMASRKAVARWVLSLAAVIVLGALPAQAAEAKQSKYASIAYDANTGDTLFETFASDTRYPASLTKIMTLYMAFELIEKNRLSLESTIPVSAQAAAQPPSKLGFEVGDNIRLIDAIKALVTKSANDVAVAIAEKIAGSEDAFARLMTKKAREIGMKNTIFKNASGLPDDGQVTTARDMVILAVRLQDDFPEHYKLFATRYFSYRGKTYKNHNTLLGAVQGVDGIKTGYIRASGFNLVSSVKRDGKHVVAVVFGGKTARSRNTHMRSIIARALKQASTRNTRKPLLIAKPRPVLRPSLPAHKPVIDQAIEVGRADPPPEPRRTVKMAKVRRHDFLRSPAPENIAVVAAPEPVAADRGRTPGTLQDQLAALLANSGIAEVARGPEQGSADDEGERQQRVESLRGPYLIQVGAFASQQEAEAQLRAVAQRADQILTGYDQRTETVAKGTQTIYRARFAGFESNAATAACTELRRRSIDCFVTRSQ
ncbi:MAG: D-alanyl-D-alanine carboxypeptidase [Alphaproteobacteria bacterium]|nr:D-alanyl-D-alanine carboxypeptidase [Alphaproteobacteria bacterium]